jgi:hypothetical protein
VTADFVEVDLDAAAVGAGVLGLRHFDGFDEKC